MSQSQDPRRGVGRLTAYFINSQLTVLIIVAIAAFGLLAALLTPEEENPQIVVPVADVALQYPGASAAVVENTLVNPVEAKLRELTGIEHIYSVAQASGGLITVQYRVGENWEDSLFKLQNQLFNHPELFPPGSSYQVQPVIVDDVPIVTLTLTGADYSDNQLRRVGERLLEDLRRIPNTSNLTIVGGHPRTIRVDLNPERLASYGLAPTQIAQRIAAENLKLPAGDLTVGSQRLQVEGGHRLGSAADVAAIQLKPDVYLEDVAVVRDDFAERTQFTRIHFRTDEPITDPNPDPRRRATGDWIRQPAITIGIAKKPGTNAVTVAQQIFQRVEELRPQLPPGIQIAVTRNDGRTAAKAVGDLYTSLVQAIGIVVALLLLFLGWREASIVAFVIPLTLAGTLGVGWIAGQTINRITLFALILALGTLVDDAIAVTENIHRRFDLRPGMDFRQKTEEAIAAVAELGTPIILSTVTVILAFLPMRFVTGMMGPYMGPIPFNVPVAMVISTTLALTVTPFLALRWIQLKPHTQAAQPALEETRLYRLYRRILQPLLESRSRRRWLSWVVTGLLLASFLLPLTQVVKFRMLPKADKDTFLVQLDMPRGADLVATDQVVQALEQVLQRDPDVASFESYVGLGSPIDFNGLLRGGSGRGGEDVADIRLHLSKPESRSLDSEQIVLRLRPKLQAVAATHNAIVKLVEDPPGPPVRSTLLAEVYGPNYVQVRQLAKRVRQIFAETAGVVDIDDSVKNPLPQLTLTVDRERVNRAGLTTADVAQTLNLALSGSTVSILQLPGELTPMGIHLRLAESARQSIEDLSRIQLPTPSGSLVPLTELVQWTPTVADEPIFHKDQRPVAYVMGEMADRSSVYAVIDQWLRVWRDPLPSGYWIQWDGEWKLTLDVFRDLGLAMLVAVLLIYLILVGQFRSFKIPLIILGSIPLALIGILLGFSLNGVYFSATAMIGVIALAGIVVRNAIVLLEFIGEQRAVGVSLEEAIFAAGAVRFRPILLTSITTMLGTVPILSDPVWSGLAWTLLSGMLTSSALTLVIIPIWYYGDQKQSLGPESTTAPDAASLPT
ncbi:efflux RND transporter permease subunit [Thermostichus vulcanus]|uniref:Efflux RND transporter permease subunit n=1 Tax=Thermostichus vulcanus str. 'Rupite' TaxID=2813851 RepID=A0ABT0C9N7_THEVL|nr:efflux RND transporter permease subunit [Thermostichus vulcanus]MCJ2542503.1 efflux RND transporter permease subunit [Thermostichus vulcanus str. 'Rupite']